MADASGSERRFVASVDFGTTTAVCHIYDAVSGAVVGVGSAQVQTYSPGPGRSEMEPWEVWRTFQSIVRSALASARSGPAGVRPPEIVALGLAVQRNSLLVWDRASGEPQSPFLTWRDGRAGGLTASLNASLRRRLLNWASALLYWVSRQKRFYLASALRFSTAMVAVRLKHLLDADSGLARRARTGQLCAGCLESWLVWRLTGGAEFATDASCASVTGLYDAWAGEWSALLLPLLGVPVAALPEVRDSDADFGAAPWALFGAGPGAVRVRAVLGDQQAALVGTGCLREGQGKLTLGTAASLVAHTGGAVVPVVGPVHPLVGWRSRGRDAFGVEGLAADTGPALDWLLHVGLLADYAELEPLLGAASPPGQDQLCFVPAFAGLMQPREDRAAGCLWIGMRADTSRADLVRAAAWGIAFQARLLLDRLRRRAGLSLDCLRVDGGLSRSDALMRTLAHALGVTVEAAATPNAAVIGAARMAGLGAGLWPTLDDSPVGKEPPRVFRPDPDPVERERWDARYWWWRLAVKRSLNWHCFEEDLL